ncbi:MAG: coenzyme F420 hydrogenase, partial [Desulfobacteraceae bacterium]|nr:coenzyme F420 hydrogenase [Desulfobacteraceae bacterium]
VELEQMESMKRYACQYCSDYSAEFADISFGGIGAPGGWTTVITRTPLGRAILADSRSFKSIEQFNVEDDPGFASNALQKVRKASALKKKKARLKRRDLKNRSVQVRI